MNLETFSDLSFGTNCYLLWKEKNEGAVLIDAGLSAHTILDFLKAKELSLRAILLTHGHPDHTVGAAQIEEETGAPVYIHEVDARFIDMMPSEILRMIGITEVKKPSEFKTVSDNQILEIAGLQIKVLHTPGHSPGSVSFLVEDSLFCGDLIFYGSSGRTDFPGGSMDVLLNSVRNNVFVLPDETKIYPGHMQKTTVGWERRTNPFLSGL
ncbi:MAG: MBL fold metallo-hydrolase [Actinomycetota bacterium]|nr:MBL fold metallo-hydrolase [Actinomycetota bacterium]